MRHRWGGDRATALILFSSMLLAATPSLAGQHAETTEARSKPDTVSKSSAPGGFGNWIERRVRSFASEGEREQGVTVALAPYSRVSTAGGVGYKHFNAFGPARLRGRGMVSFRRYQMLRSVWSPQRPLVDRRTRHCRPASRRVVQRFSEQGTRGGLLRRGPISRLSAGVYYGGGIPPQGQPRRLLAIRVSVDGVWQRQFNSSIGLSVRGGVLDLRVGTGTNATLVNFEERCSSNHSWRT